LLIGVTRDTALEGAQLKHERLGVWQAGRDLEPATLDGGDQWAEKLDFRQLPSAALLLGSLATGYRHRDWIEPTSAHLIDDGTADACGINDQIRSAWKAAQQGADVADDIGIGLAQRPAFQALLIWISSPASSATARAVKSTAWPRSTPMVKWGLQDAVIDLFVILVQRRYGRAVAGVADAL
jgi:hypothetical protein